MKQIALGLLLIAGCGLASGCNKNSAGSRAEGDRPDARDDGRDARDRRTSQYSDDERWFQKSHQTESRAGDESRTAWRKAARKQEWAIEQAEDRADAEADRPHDEDTADLRSVAIDEDSVDVSDPAEESDSREDEEG